MNSLLLQFGRTAAVIEQQTLLLPRYPYLVSSFLKPVSIQFTLLLHARPAQAYCFAELL